jgi:HlyD family secretion protein
MRTRKQIVIVALIAIAMSSGYGFYVRDRGVVVVQAGSVIRQDLTQTVSANGEIKPKKYVNVSSNMMGRIVRLPVKEGDRVHKGDLLVKLEAVQSQADVSSAEASLDAAQTDIEGMAAAIRAAEAGVTSAKAEITRSEADMVRAKLAFARSQEMAKEGLIAREEFEGDKAAYDVAEAELNSANAHLAQCEAQLDQTLKQRDSTSIRTAQQRASLIRARDQFSKTTIRATLDGIITSLPVNEGEIAIVGVQNQPGTTLMTIADMSIITAEVRVDETDIVSVKLGQEAMVKVDALGDRMLEGRITEIGNSALVRSTSISAADLSNGTSTGSEAKDFKVVITLDEPPPELRPGLSCTATIVTAMREKILTIPIQALTIRELPAAPGKKKIEQEGVFLLVNDIAFFRPVKTGITGTTEIEVLRGLSENDQVVTGPYQALRTLQDKARIEIQKAP